MAKKGKISLNDLGIWGFTDKKLAQDLDPEKLADQEHFYEAIKLFYDREDQDGIRKVMSKAFEAGDLVDARFGERMLRKLSGALESVLTESDLEHIAAAAESQGKPSIRVFLNKEKFRLEQSEEKQEEKEE